MKKYTAICFFMLAVGVGGCHKKPALTIPLCILQKMEEIRKQPKWNPPARVEEYIFEGRKVFVFSAPCCDQYNEAYDESCNYICAPTGGFTGKGDGKCRSFITSAQFVKLVWKDER